MKIAISRGMVLGLTALLVNSFPLELQVSFAGDGSNAQVRVMHSPAREPLAALRLGLRLKEGVAGDAIGLTKAASGPWSQFLPAAASEGPWLEVFAMAPAAGARGDSGLAEIARLEFDLAPNASPRTAADLIDSVAIREAYSPAGQALVPQVSMTTGLKPLAKNPSAPTFRERGRTRTLLFNLGREQRVRAWVSDLRGRRIADLIDRKLPAGVHEAVWNGLTAAGAPPARGVYVFHLEAGLFRYDRKLEVAR